MSGKKDMKQALDGMRHDGYVVEYDGAGHYRVSDPLTGERVRVPSTPSSRGFRNGLSRLKRLRRARADHSV